MDDQKQLMQMCVEDPTPAEIQQCFLDTAGLTKVFFTHFFQNSQKCDDPKLTMLRNKFAVPMMNVTIEKIADTLRELADIKPIATTAPAPMSFIKIMFDINNAMKESPGCFREELKRAQSEMISKYQAGQICNKYRRHATVETCFKGVIDDIQAVFRGIDEETEDVRCADEDLYPIQVYVSEGFENTTPEDLMTAIKAFAQAPLGSAPAGVVNTATSAPPSATMPLTTPIPIPAIAPIIPTSIPAAKPIVPAIVKPATPTLCIDFSALLKKLTAELDKAGCFKAEMKTAKINLQKYRDYAMNCPTFDNGACYATTGRQIHKVFKNIDDQLTGVRCVDWTFSPILRDTLSKLAACNSDDLTIAVKALGMS